MVFSISFLGTFLSILAGTKKGWTHLIVKIGRYHIHHSVFGIIFMGVGLVFTESLRLLFPVGLGMYLSHGFEEFFINKRKIPGSLFVFVTKLAQ